MSAEFFTSETNPALDGVVKPVFWRRWTLWKKFDWIREQGLAENQLEAMEVLKAWGEWPEQEVEEIPSRVITPAPPEDVEVVKQAPPDGYGRRDSLKGIY